MSLQPPGDKRASLADAVSLVSDGATVALGGGLSARLPMAMVRELVRQGRRGLHLVGSAHGIVRGCDRLHKKKSMSPSLSMSPNSLS